MTNPTTPIIVGGDALIDWFETTTGSKQSRMDAKKKCPTRKPIRTNTNGQYLTALCS
jgi:hypothetical protein